MKNTQIKLFAGAAVMLVMAAACAKVAENDWEEAGEIRFSASAQAPEVEFPATKTAYGAVSGSTKILTWSANDQISIYAPNEFNYYAGEATIPAISYKITDQTLDGTTSTATGVTVVTANTALQWGSATGAGSHKFYGRYPDPTWETGANTPYASELFKNQELKSAYFTCYLPAMQPFSRTEVENVHVCAPSMKYLYMTAYAAVERNATVALDFKPAVSTFHIRLANKYVGETFTVKSVELVSKSQYLTGSYSVDIAASASNPVLSSNTGADADKRAGVDFGAGLLLSYTPAVPPSTPEVKKILDVTIFTRPVALNDLSIVITTTNGDVQKLELKDDKDAYLSFPAGKYFEITCGDVPDPFVYTLDIGGGDVVAATGANAGTVANPYTLEIDCQGTTKTSTFSLVSSKEKLGLITATSWMVEYSSNGSSWSTTSPVNDFSVTAPTYAGSTAGETVTVRMPAGSSGSLGTIVNTFSFTSTNGGPDDDAPLDLSYYDGVADEVLATQETANCYIIRGAGWYKFPLVYGNGIKNGAPNTPAYHLASAGSGQLQNFVKGDGTAIYSAGTIADVKITTATTVDLLWQDCTDNIFTTIKLDDLEGSDGIKDHLVFHVENPKPCNAVIQVKNAEETVLWSWHIWLVADEQNLAKVNVTNYGSPGRTFGMLTSNLGQLPITSMNAYGYPSQDVYVRFSATADPVKAQSVVLKVTRPRYITSSSGGTIVNPFYQWGRKDPMLTAATNDAERTKDGSSPGNSYKGSLSYPPSNKNNYQNATTIANAIRNPGIFYTDRGSGGDNWFTGGLYYNLWDTGQTSTTPPSDYPSSTKPDSIKSVYDPCPRGYKVARKFDYTGFTTTGTNSYDEAEFNVIGSFNKGWTYEKNSSDTEGLFFPASGTRSRDDGKVENRTTGGLYWTSSSKDTSFGSVFRTQSNGTLPLGYETRAWAYSVRPVADD